MLVRKNFSWTDKEQTTAVFEVDLGDKSQELSSGTDLESSLSTASRSLSIHFLDPDIWSRNRKSRSSRDLCLYHPKTPYSKDAPNFRGYMAPIGCWLADAWSLLNGEWWGRAQSWLKHHLNIVGSYNFPSLIPTERSRKELELRHEKTFNTSTETEKGWALDM